MVRKAQTSHKPPFSLIRSSNTVDLISIRQSLKCVKLTHHALDYLFSTSRPQRLQYGSIDGYVRQREKIPDTSLAWTKMLTLQEFLVMYLSSLWRITN